MRKGPFFVMLIIGVLLGTQEGAASYYCPIQVAQEVVYQRVKNALLRARLALRDAVIRGRHDVPDPHSPKPEIGYGPVGVFVPYVPPPKEALKGFWNKIFYYDAGWLANLPIRKASKQVPVAVQSVLQAYGFDVSGAVPQAEHQLAPIRTVGLTLTDQLVFRPIDRFLLSNGDRVSEGVRYGVPSFAFTIALYMQLVAKPTAAFFDWATEKRKKGAKEKTIESDPEFLDLKRALAAMKIDLDTAIDRMDHMRNQYLGLREAWAGLTETDPSKSGARSAAELAVAMLERHPPGSRFGEFSEAQRNRLSEQAQFELITEELVWQALDIAPETLGYLQEGPPAALFPKANLPKVLTRAQKIDLVEQAFARLLMASDERVFFEEWNGEMPADPPPHAAEILNYFSTGPQALILRDFKAKKVSARQAVAMTLGWEIWRLRLTQWEIMGLPLTDENRQQIVQIVTEEILKSGGDTSKLPR